MNAKEYKRICFQLYLVSRQFNGFLFELCVLCG